jgi:hypothetical protein
MEFNILDIKELENGGTEIIANMDDDTIRYLVNYAIIDILKKQLQEVDDLWKQKPKT